jgi:cytidine deaminase
MEIKTIPFTYQEYNSPEELQAPDRDLLERAKQALSHAYAPYSQYQVGSAVLLGNGEVVTGNNQENMAFPSGLCAERVAIYAASANWPGVPVKTIAISAHSKKFPVTDPVPPCGSCRQAMIEYEMLQKENIRVILQGDSGKVFVIGSIESLLPLSFRENGLKKK